MLRRPLGSQALVCNVFAEFYAGSVVEVASLVLAIVALTVPLGLDFTSGYATTVYVVGGLLLLVAAAEKLWGWSRWVRQNVGSQTTPVTGSAPGQPQLDARMRKTGKTSYVMDIENTGEVPVEQVEVDMPSEAFNWQLLTDGLASYPIPVLEPGDRQAAHVAVTMGPHASIEVTLRGLVDGDPYERRRTVSVIGA